MSSSFVKFIFVWLVAFCVIYIWRSLPAWKKNPARLFWYVMQWPVKFSGLKNSLWQSVQWKNHNFSVNFLINLWQIHFEISLPCDGDWLLYLFDSDEFWFCFWRCNYFLDVQEWRNGLQSLACWSRRFFFFRFVLFCFSSRARNQVNTNISRFEMNPCFGRKGYGFANKGITHGDFHCFWSLSMMLEL